MKRKKRSKDRLTRNIAEVAAGIGVGVLAGIAGTIVMTAAQMIEMKYSGRKSSDTPYKAVKKTFGVEAQTKEDKELITNVTHIAYGTTWGIPRGLMAVFGASGTVGTTIHFGGVWGTELSLLPAMDVIKPVTTWEPKAVAKDAMFHAVYAITVGLTADALARRIKYK